MNADFAELLQQAVMSAGQEYQSARDSLTRTGEYVPDLRRIAGTTEPWAEAWVARIALGWIEQPALYARAAEFIEGKLPGPVPLSGTFSPDRRGQKIAELGPQVAPRLIEIVWKTHEYPDDGRLGAVFVALENLALPETRPPLHTLLDRSTPRHYRHGAIAVLGSMADAGAAEALRSIAVDTAEDEEIRAAALDAYAATQPDDLFDLTASTLRNAGAPPELRQTAARILTDRRDPGTRELFHEVIRSGADEDLLVTVVDGLAQHGDSTSIKLLQNLSSRTTSDVLRQVIEETIAELE